MIKNTTKKEKVYVYIDGSNLYWNLKTADCADMSFNFQKFIKNLVGKRALEGVRYYIGQIKPKDGDEKSQKLHRHQQRLFEKLKKAGFYIVRGRLRQIGEIFTEKGVDMRIGIDLVEGAYENRYDTAVLISSDVGFSYKPSYALIQHASTYHNFNKETLKQFTD